MEKSNLIVALLIDADNAPAKKIDFIMSELANYGSVMVRKIYGNWKDDRLKSWENVLLDYALAPVQQFDYTKGKNATDMAMTIDVMDLLFLNKVDVFCLVSSDCDFTPLAMRIKASGKQVIGFGEHKTPKSLVAACSKFLFLDNAQSRTAPTEQQVQRKTAQELKGDSTLMNLLRNSIAANRAHHRQPILVRQPQLRLCQIERFGARHRYFRNQVVRQPLAAVYPRQTRQKIIIILKTNIKKQPAL